ncbi:MAG: RdgB/HAM1 family non-canonical purine NTP pyrophosphatase [Alphaproteobacteria bacterium]
MSSIKPSFKSGETVIIASHNPGKIDEFKTLFSKYNLKIKTSAELNVKDVIENGKTFEENSVLKVKSISNQKIVIGDDSGLCVNSLNNMPGIFSARFARECGGWDKAMKRIYQDLIKKSGNFSAKFVCSLSIKFLEDKIFSYYGEIHGEITWPPKGKNGFGYDPFFIPNSYDKTFAEMDHKEKILIDHRSVALKKLIISHLDDS